MKSSRRGFFGISLGGAAAVADGSLGKEALGAGEYTGAATKVAENSWTNSVGASTPQAIGMKDHYKHQIEHLTTRLRNPNNFKHFIDDNQLATMEINSLRSINAYTKLNMCSTKLSRITTQREKAHIEAQLQECIDKYTSLGGVFDVVRGFLK